MATEGGAAGVAAAIGEPARARMLYTLLDNRARTATELAATGGVAASTASAHLDRLLGAGLLRVSPQGKHRYYRLAGPEVARVLEGLSGLAGGRPAPFAPSTPDHLRLARTCYDHLAGAIAVAWCDRLHALGWLRPGDGENVAVTAEGAVRLADLGVDVSGAQARRRRFAYPCLDWSERRPHLGGALGAALLQLAREQRWVTPPPEGRGLDLTRRGRRAFRENFRLEFGA